MNRTQMTAMKILRGTPAMMLAAAITASACSSPPTAPSDTMAGSQAPLVQASPSGASAAVATPSRFGDRTPGVIYVTSQGLYYDTFATRDPLPMQGRFQLLAEGRTEFGPGDPGYVGGRWWEDLNGNGIQDEGDHFFLCPLLPPGRPTP